MCERFKADAEYVDCGSRADGSRKGKEERTGARAIMTAVTDKQGANTPWKNYMEAQVLQPSRARTESNLQKMRPRLVTIVREKRCHPRTTKAKASPPRNCYILAESFTCIYNDPSVHLTQIVWQQRTGPPSRQTPETRKHESKPLNPLHASAPTPTRGTLRPTQEPNPKP